MSVSEALSILKNSNSVILHAANAIRERCNLPDNNATTCKLRRRLQLAIDQRKEAIRRGNLATWCKDAEMQEFCQHLPAAAAALHEDTGDVEYVPTPPARPGRSKAPLSSTLNRSTVDKRVDAVLQPLQDIADAENTPIVQLLLIALVKLCRRCHWTSLAKLLYSVFICMTDIDMPNVMSMEKSAYMMVSQELGRDRYTDLRSTLLSEGFEAQPWYKVNDHCESITPERIPVILDQDEGVCGYRYSFEEVCKYFVNRALLAANIDSSNIPDRLFIGGKDGTDGSGQHYRRATVHVAIKGNILLYCFAPLVLCDGNNVDGEVLWRNTAPNSALTQRPLAVIGAKEDRDAVLRPLIPMIEEEIVAVCRDGFTMTCMGKDVHVAVKSDLSMFDGKMHAALQGTGGTFYQLCKC